MNMYMHELKSLRKSTLVWTLAMITLAIIYLSVYPSIVKDAADFRKLLEGYPAQVRAMLGISLDYLTSLVGFYSIVFGFITLCGAIQAMIFGVSIITKESRERTADFLLVKPVSRSSIVTSKLLAAITMLAITNVFYFITTLFLANMVKTTDYSNKLFFMVNLTLFFIQLIFLSIGFIVSVVIPKLKSVLPISLGVVIGFYFIGAFITLGDSDLARYFSPFKYFSMPYILNNSSYETPFLITGIIITFVAIIASYIIYINKDIHSVS